MIQTPSTDPRNVLTLASAASPIESVRRALDSDVSLDGWNVLLIAYGHDHERLRSAWHDRIGDTPANFGSISVGSDIDARHRTAAVSRADRDVSAVIHDPTSLTELGITIGLYLDDWTTGRTLVCFHSLEDLLGHVGAETAFRFVHVLTRRLSSADAIGQFSLDPSALDERRVRTLKSMFDAVHEADTDEEPPSVSPDVAFDVLRAPRRRHVLHYLRRCTSPTTCEELAGWLTYHEPETSAERIETSLYHTHLPKLEDAGLVVSDGTQVTGRLAIDSLVPYLDLVSDYDLPD